MKQVNFILSLLFLIVLYSCNSEELKAPVPAYISINDVEVKTNSPFQGSTSDNITNVKVFINDQSIGNFELPAQIPIQTTGQVTLKVLAGIQNNGLSNDIADYPFYQFYENPIFLKKDSSYNITPVVEYSETAKYDNPAWSGEDFESGVNFNEIPTSDTILVRTSEPDEVFEGSGSGKGFLTVNQRFFETISKTIPNRNIPTDGRAVYLEMNYKCTHDISVRMYNSSLSQISNVVFFRAKDNWTKVYIELSPVFSSLFTASDFNIAIGYAKPLGVEGKLLLDNVKLIHN